MDVADLFDADLSDAVAAETLKNISVPPCPEIIVELLG